MNKSGKVSPSWAAFEARDDLSPYGDNGLLLFVAQLRLSFDDVDTFASNSLTDGANDKKCDLVAVSADRQQIVVAQGYMAQSMDGEAPANKASDLNTAVSWLLAGELEALPDALRGAAEEVRDALLGGEIKELQLWYVHNRIESKNVEDELRQARLTADSLLKRDFPLANVDVSALEIGRVALEEEYARTQAPILVSDEISFEVPGGFEIVATDWSALSTAVNVQDLRELWQKHSTRLMSPNIRDYLGVVRSSGNINYGIKDTATSQPDNFAIYNNGITVLVNDYVFEAASDGKPSATLSVKGIGIVNGGQTTGALGSLTSEEAESTFGARVMARFVKCSNIGVLGDIVKYNNTQNKVEASDFRSKDAIQERLRNEFVNIPEADYRGGRRGGATDAILRLKTLVPDSSAAQSLAAFHGDPNVAYNETRSIWESDAVYARIFRETVTARHIVYTYGLLKAVEQAKQRMVAIPQESRTEAQKRHAAFFQARGSTFLLVSAIGDCIETILGSAIPDRYSLRFVDNCSPAQSVEAWREIVEPALAFSGHLLAATDRGLRSRDRVKEVTERFGSMLEAVRSANADPFDEMARRTELG